MDKNGKRTGSVEIERYKEANSIVDGNTLGGIDEKIVGWSWR